MAVNWEVPPACTEAVRGAMTTEMSGETLTVALSFLVASATLVATTWNVPGVAGAVYLPAASMLPPAAPSWTDQVTAVD